MSLTQPISKMFFSLHFHVYSIPPNCFFGHYFFSFIMPPFPGFVWRICTVFVQTCVNTLCYHYNKNSQKMSLYFIKTKWCLKFYPSRSFLLLVYQMRYYAFKEKKTKKKWNWIYLWIYIVLKICFYYTINHVHNKITNTLVLLWLSSQYTKVKHNKSACHTTNSYWFECCLLNAVALCVCER